MSCSQFSLLCISEVEKEYMYGLLKTPSTVDSSVFCLLQDDKIETEEQSYQVSQTAIKDKSMLSTQAQKLCENIDAHWMTPTCGADSKERKCSQYLCLSIQFHINSTV